MAIEKVRSYFATLGKDNGIMEFDVSSATVELAAKAVGVEPARIAKTLSFKVSSGCVLIVTAGDSKIDNSKYKAQFNTKAVMLTADEVPAMTGHEIGGVCPFANPAGCQVFCDVSLRRFATVFPACGSSSSAIELSCDELEKLSGCSEWIDVCKQS